MRKKIILYILVPLVFVGCARRTSISGGPKDSIPPTLRYSTPDNYSTNFKAEEIKLNFDEYVKLKNVTKQLIISPPLAKQPVISPMVASRQFTISLQDSLATNTTYSFNFGTSIEDNNEGNALRQFKYVFSTGSFIDSLALKGSVKDAFNLQPDPFISVMLYDAQTFTDSTVFKSNPKYITSTLDSARTFTLDHLKAGNYYILAIKDHNGNNRFDPGSEKIAFHKHPVRIPNDTLYEMELFQEEKPFKVIKAIQESGSKLLVGYQGSPKAIKAQLFNKEQVVPCILSKMAAKDSLLIWHEESTADSLELRIEKGAYRKSSYIQLKNRKPDSLALSISGGGLHLRDVLKINSTVPIKAIQDHLIYIRDKDSTLVKFTSTIDNYHLSVSFNFDRQPVQRYSMLFLPGAVTDMFGRVNDTLSFNFGTKNTSDYGNLRLMLENVKRFPIIIELTDDKGKLITSQRMETAGALDFALIDPRAYILRVIYDDNKNGQWDTGNFMAREQPEEVIYFPKPIEVRANWDIEQVFSLP